MTETIWDKELVHSIVEKQKAFFATGSEKQSGHTKLR